MPLVEKKEAVSSVLFKRTVEFQPPPLSNKKAFRAEDVFNQIVTVNGFTFDADEESMDRMGRVISIAHWKYNQAVASGVPHADAYQAVYIGTTVPWKLHDNEKHDTSIETLCMVQEQALYALSTIWVKYG